MKSLDDQSRGGLGSRKDPTERSVAERSISYMQKRQANAQGQRSKANSIANADEIFSRASAKQDIAGNTEDGPKYFQKRLNSQQQKRRTQSYFDGVVRRNTNDPMRDIAKQNANGDSHAHLNSFLRDQIMRKQGQTIDQDKRSRYSASASSQKRSNALIERAAQGTNGADLLNMVMISGYQADPLAAALNQKSIGLSKLNVTKKQMDDDKQLFDRTVNVRGGIGLLHMTPQLQGKKHIDETRSTRSAKSRANSTTSGFRGAQGATLGENDQREIIKNALNRKQISHGYHTTLPKFMKSQGPFAVYDHAVHKGDSSA